ncbi:MAG TPA: efflux RND transporter periplasmic adaptor subunit [Leptospiraceae bacterium]|nr:efflux RND transporter periplasmic adaptor subunit [Leptospiraceae bacterium]HMX34970.1 efflux RND transporter periplasmic adaptor subunit [Leptospiraceae bacterium]HMY33520.1 efflux RND transporter periplasmic adaptor subunit [Leptospiraceae bacterium]HMZ66107.1 efflux RND transporter periplasmic adaptor subunit [Leptospiraceae bacterium]HNA09711.1 efflux RND transporter periplasmic adaptor subunit [Leptospiraceae bacterium]
MIKHITKKDAFKFVGIGFILFILFEVAIRFYSFHQLKKETLEAAIPTVAIIHPAPPNPIETITLPGTLKAWYEAPIYAQVSGYVKMWYKDYGAEVEKGDLLAEVQTPALDAEFAQAKADLQSQDAKYQLADVTANRYLSLQKSHAVSDQSISVAVADKNAEKAKLQAAMKNVHKYEALINFKRIVAPFKGIVTQRNINVGDYVNKDGNLSDNKPITNLFTVSDIHKMRLFVSVPGSFAYLLKSGLTADVTVAQFAQKTFKANFITIAKGFDPGTQTVLAEFSIDNEDRTLWPGSYATVNMTAPVKKDLLTIPSSALVFNEKGTQVAVVTKENKIHFKPIQVSKIMDTIVEILDGVTMEDSIINNPRTSFLEGDTVRIVAPREGY